MEITRKSMLGGEHTMEINVTTEQLLAWQRGTLIQEAMPNITAVEREFILTGITPEQWNTTFGDATK
jgi:hypothetical protein